MDTQTEVQGEKETAKSPATKDPAIPSATVTVSLDDMEQAILAECGLFVMTIPLNSKKVNRVKAYGWVVEALFRIYGLYQSIDKLKADHAARLKKGDLSLLSRVGAGIKGVLGG